ncbi:hypothetical protein ACFE04_018243 [Oxalis oulophora]
MAGTIQIILAVISICFLTCDAQSNSCNGIFLSYNYTNGYQIPPNDTTNQPYRFESTLTVLNNGLDELNSWRVFVGFRYDEVLVSITNAALGDGASLPARVGNGSVLVGYPKTDLKTPIETAGDLPEREVRIQLVGTQFGVRAPDIPLPDSLILANDGYACPDPETQGNEMHLCCVKDPNFKTNISVEDDLSPLQDGDLVIMYDIISSHTTNYWAQVSVSIHNSLGRLDYWQLSWDWMRDEFIYAMKGAYPNVVDTLECITGRQGEYYQDMDFSEALSCERRPTIVDLPQTRVNDTNLGMIPFCCRNGTILPPHMDETRSMSVFQMNVFKMPPDLNRTELHPPQNFKIHGTMNPDYQCGQPIRVSPSIRDDPSELSSGISAMASWQVICNITRLKDEKPKCCVSFSAYFNDSAIPCNTCACGCNKNPGQTCSATTPALLEQPDSLLIPFENRTKQIIAWADTKKLRVPNPLPCGDNCGVSINWHLVSNYKDGWTARITLFNWGETSFVDWFTAVELDKAMAGFEKVYSFNGSALPGSNNTIFMQGVSGLNYLLAERDGNNPKKDPRVPGMLQSVILFKKKLTPDIDVAGGDGFPTRFIFNGEECALPTTLLTGNAQSMRATTLVVCVLALFALFF